MKHKIPLVIDCDPGIDDSFALVYTHLVDSFDVKAIFSVAGNVPIEMTTLNSEFICSELDLNVPIYRGAEGPLVGEPIIAKYAHGSNGLGGYQFDENTKFHASHENPTDAYYKLLSNLDEPIIIAAIGPLTNLAKLFMAYPDVNQYIKAIYVMGGGILKGNYTASAEFNIAADPLAAQIVINSGVKQYYVPLDTTTAHGFNRDFMVRLKDSKNEASQLLFKIIDAKENLAQSPNSVYYLHDLITIISIHHPEWFDLIDVHIAVELNGTHTTGMTIFDLRVGERAQKPNAVYVAHPKFEFIQTHVLEVLL